MGWYQGGTAHWRGDAALNWAPSAADVVNQSAYKLRFDLTNSGVKSELPILTLVL